MIKTPRREETANKIWSSLRFLLSLLFLFILKLRIIILFADNAAVAEWAFLYSLQQYPAPGPEGLQCPDNQTGGPETGRFWACASLQQTEGPAQQVSA